MSAESKCIVPNVLLLASRYDLTCDYVVAQLRRKSIPYFRLNTEDLSDSMVELDPVRRDLVVERQGQSYRVTPEGLRSVFFRRPVYLRDYGDDNRPPAERFSRYQWAAFVRNLMLFHEARWVNDPTATYRAEHKAVQLWAATQAGFVVPETRVTNSPHTCSLGRKCRDVAIKGLDTVLLRTGGYEMFGFTTFESLERLNSVAWRSAPAVIQAALADKLDIRVTVIENRVFAASITAHGKPIAGDWRKRKSNARFHEFDLPKEMAERCRLLVKSLGLRFGAIDLALCKGEYYFFEINPTGEWAWLVDTVGFPIDKAIAEVLSENEPSNAY